MLPRLFSRPSYLTWWESHYIETVYTEIYMSYMADHVGKVPILCTKIIYMLLCTTNIGIA